MQTWITGYPRIGRNRELKFALEKFWGGHASWDDVVQTGVQLRARHWREQAASGASYISVNDFSFYDGMLDTVVMLGLIPRRFEAIGDPVARYFAMARGDDATTAMAMSKWMNTNYHYLVPELTGGMLCRIDTSKIEAEYREARAADIPVKINLIGPMTFLLLARLSDGSVPYGLFDEIVSGYVAVLGRLGLLDETVTVQMDEPVFAADRSAGELSLLKLAYERLAAAAPNIRLAVVTYFDEAGDAARVLAQTPVWAIGLDFVDGSANLDILQEIGQSGKTVIAGVVSGRNVWRMDAVRSLALVRSLTASLGEERLILAPSCSLLHVPYTTDDETGIDPAVRSWLAFAAQKLDELTALAAAASGDVTPVWETIVAANVSRGQSPLTRNDTVRSRMVSHPFPSCRATPYAGRIALQREAIGYGVLPTTTIGSFPQTADIRSVRAQWRKGEISSACYEEAMREAIADCIARQETIGLDILVHGEFERTDMVEYFGEQLDGVAISRNGWVQSYGTRCVKPPLIYGDVARRRAMTVDWTVYAQSLTDKPVKGMLTGPVTILNWSFVRDDQPRGQTAMQVAYAMAQEIDELQREGIGIIQVDEAAFKEGYPLRRAGRDSYESWAVESFVAATAVAWDRTQIHTHMCYSDFNDIIDAIDALDADVITIETARNGNRLLDAFKRHAYSREIGPGIYDIHSPRIPSVEEMTVQIRAILEIFPARQIWINPDCGLKTRGWRETDAALTHMVQAVHDVRQSLQGDK